MMSDLDIETIEWLNTLKLGDKLSYLSDFENGYYMGVIFQRMNLSKGKKFKNTNDMACKFQNFKNIRDLLYQNFKVDFPIQNILFNTDNLLKTIRDSIKKYNKDKKQATLRRIQTFSESKIQPNEEKMFASRQKDILFSSKMNQTAKLPKKIQEIEHKLEKYREIKTKHELIALEDRKKQIEENRRLVEEHRLFEMNKIRTNHEFMKEHERKVYDVWMKTEQIKKTRIEKDNNLKSFMEEKKNKFYQSLRQQEVNSLKDGLQAFQMNCIRQGIELDHDPDKPPSKTEENFNKQVVMERIKDNIKSHDKERKDRIKRENKKNVDAKEANSKAEKIWNQNSLIEKYAKAINENIQKCQDLTKKINRENAEKRIIIEKSQKKKYIELAQSQIDQEQRNTELRQKMMKYREEEIVRLEKKDKELKNIGVNALEALIHIVVQNQQAYFKNKGFDYFQWKKIENDFLKYQKKQKKLLEEVYVDPSFDLKVDSYVNKKGEWKLQKNGRQLKFKTSQILQKIIDKAYPQSQPPSKSDLPLYMPLKIFFSGNRLSGKTTLAQKIANKYGIMIINPLVIINEAFQLNKQPIVEDPKKKKDSKKPEEENPEKIALKGWGEKLIQKLDDPANATIQHFIEAIEFKLKLNFNNKNQEEIVQEYELARSQQAERFTKVLKDFQEAQKKGKKDSKKVGDSDEPPTERKYFYTKGFILDGIELSLDDITKMQKKLNGFISFEEKINKAGQQLKSQISSVISIPKAMKQDKLQKGTFDLFFHLDASLQTLETRQSGEKIMIVDKNDKNVQKYYSNFGNEKTRTLAYHSVNNNQTVEESVQVLSKIIESYLDSKYDQIQSYKTKTKETKKGIDFKEEIKEVPSPQGQFQPITQGEVGKQQKQSSSSISIKKQKLANQHIQYSQEIELSKIEQLSQQKSIMLIARLKQFFEKYLKNISVCFMSYDQLRSDFSTTLIHVQQKFTSIINRPDDKAGKILTFQQNYNKLLVQKRNIVKDVEASKHLISKLDQLNDGLWVSIQAKKNEAVSEREKILNSNILNSEVEKVIEVTKKLCQNELTLLVEIIFFLYNVNNVLQGRSDDIPTEYLVLGIPPNLQPIKSIELTEFISDRLDYYLNQTRACIKQLPDWLKKKEKKFSIVKSRFIEGVLSDFIDKQTKVIEKRLEKVQSKIKQKYLEYYCFFRVLTNKMDDWIIQGIKHENLFVYDIYKTLKNNILQAKKSGVKDLFVKDITDLLHPFSGLPPMSFPVVETTSPNQFKILSFLIFMQEIKCLAAGGKIPFKVFKPYIEKRKKSKWLSEEFLTLQLDIMQQYLVTEDYCNYKEVALAMLLWKNKILLEDSINDYHKSLCGFGGPTSEEKYQYYKEQLTFQEFQIMPGVTADEEETFILKVFIYEIFRQEFKNKLVVKDYIDTLRLFSQLQVFRYGDTLMILHEGGDNHYEHSE